MIQLETLYTLARSSITHNATLGRGLWLEVGDPKREAITQQADGLHIYLPALLGLCVAAVDAFGLVAHDVIPKSLANRELEDKTDVPDEYQKQVDELIKKFKGMGSGEQITVTARDR